MTIKEKWAAEIAEQVRNGASESDVIALLWEYLNEEVDDKTRYDVDDNGEVVRHPQGDYSGSCEQPQDNHGDLFG